MKNDARLKRSDYDWNGNDQFNGFDPNQDQFGAGLLRVTNAAGAGGSGGSGNSSTTTSTGTSTNTASAGSHLTINVSYDSSVNSAPSGFKTAIASVVQYFENLFTNPVTVNIDVGWGEIDGQSMGSGLGESMSYLTTCSYSQLTGALRSTANTTAAQTAAASLSASDPTNGGRYCLTTAEAKALSLTSYQGLDGYVGFGSGYSYCWNDSSGVPAGQIDFFAVAAHEISEVLGRQMMDGASGYYEPLDLFHYSASGVRDFVGTQPGYFSINGGATNLDSFNTNPGGDFGDWASSAGNDAFDAFSSAGVVNSVSQADITVMNALGWQLASGGSGGTPQPQPQPQPQPPQPHARVAEDFNGDGTSDILWRNANGSLADWLMKGGTLQSSVSVGTMTTDWTVAGVGDFNGDGTSDVLWRNKNGSDSEWTMQGGTVTSKVNLAAMAPGWSVAGIGDFNGDGTSDIFWHSTSGSNVEWQMSGGTVAKSITLGTMGAGWSVAGVGDFNGDGTSDILWHNTNGSLVEWQMSGGSLQKSVNLGTYSTAWSIAGIGDFNGDHTDDILWRSTAGSLVEWQMSQGLVAGSSSLGTVSTQWSIAEIADINGDGKADMIWHNLNGSTAAWLMNGATPLGSTSLGTVSTDWSIEKTQSATIGLN